jgi:hypothetical protein
MPRGELNKQEFKHILLKLKNELYNENIYNWNISPKELAHKYLNKALDAIDEYGR